MRLTRHAKLRARERGCQLLSLELIKHFGQFERAPGSAKGWIANRQQRRRILEALKAMQYDFEKPDPLYFIESSDGAVVTIGRRTRKINRR